MNHAVHNSIVSFIWGIVDDVLRDVYVRGKYRDVVLPMTVIRRIDCLLELTKDKVLIFERLPVEVSQDVEYQNVKDSGDRQNAKITYRRRLEEKFRKMIFSHTELYRKFADDPEFQEWILDVLFKQDYDSQKGYTSIGV